MTILHRKEFYFLRHGETEHNAKRIYSEKELDLPINERGQEQALSLRTIVQGLPVQTICHSPLRRAKETMHLAADQHSALRIEVEGLRECLSSTWLKMVTLEKHLPPCEEVQAFFERTLQGINHALSHPDPVLMIAHGGVHWALCRLLNIEDHDWLIGNCDLVHFRPVSEQWEARLVHTVSHREK